jgi:GxxExxY protein
MTKLLHAELTGTIIKAYYQVYNSLSQTFPEFIYERAMMKALEKQGISCVKQDEYQIFYKDRLVGLQRLDIFVAGKVVVELKVAAQIETIHLAQLMSYLKTVGCEVGLLFRFGGPHPEFSRRVLSGQEWDRAPMQGDQGSFSPGQDLLFPELVYDIVGGLYDVFRLLGPGFIHRIYTKACFHEMKLRGLAACLQKGLSVYYEGEDIGTIKFGHIQIEDKVLVFPIAIRDTQTIHMENFKEWMSNLKVPLGILANFNAIHLEPLILRI